MRCEVVVGKESESGQHGDGSLGLQYACSVRAFTVEPDPGRVTRAALAASPSGVVGRHALPLTHVQPLAPYTVFVLDNSGSMGQRCALGTSLLDNAKIAVQRLLKLVSFCVGWRVQMRWRPPQRAPRGTQGR